MKEFVKNAVKSLFDEGFGPYLSPKEPIGSNISRTPVFIVNHRHVLSSAKSVVRFSFPKNSGI